MSGPTAVVITVDQVAVLVAAATIRAGEAIAQGYAQAAQLREEHEAARTEAGALQSAASEQGQTALENEARAAETKLEQLATLAARLNTAERVQGTRPLRPTTSDPISLAAYVRALQQLARELEIILLNEAAKQNGDLTDLPNDLTLTTEATLPHETNRLSQRLTARIAHLGSLPDGIQALARELDATPPGERADLLASELRQRIQLHLETVQQRMVQEATSTVVEQSLKDLGYQVEDINETLFVEGGMVHFRRSGWGNYMVRMRVDAKESTANFNVIRAVAAGDNERSVLDHIAEDRWCAEFPALLKALEARGVHLNVTRRLPAGELPVQLVDRDKLPRFADDDVEINVIQPLAREIK